LSCCRFACPPGFAQAERTDLVADKLIRDAALVRGVGHARAKTGGLVLQADEAALHKETGELELRGHVHVTLPAREDHTVIRYGSGVLLTDQIVGLTADRLTLKNGLLAAYGNIVVVPVDPELPQVQLRGDELFLYLKIADATLRGNVRANNLPKPLRYLPFPFMPVFPPDIIK
jgi:hypothetical protein